MAEQITHDVVKEAQSMGGPSPIDDNATSTSTPAGNGKAPPATSNVNSKPSEALPTTSTNATNKEESKGDVSQLSDKADSALGTLKDRLLNGDSGEYSASEEANSQLGLGDVSGGSDTDISRPGSVDPTKELLGGHLRSNSVKKPASFKSVSVTKNFLAKSAVSIPAARPGEKLIVPGQTNGPAQLTAKPRLVAKSGSGNLTSRSSLSNANGGGSGPDASKVWNKNQPVPPPPPKQFTDEELKQQYGIHMATRLQADDNGKEAKWADIDDDEDDWAPETVQWMDGTKSTVAAVEAEPVPPPPEVPKVVAKPEPSTDATIPAPTTAQGSQRPSSTMGNKTILKPGAHTQTGTKSGLILKGQPEKPTLVAKPSAPTPIKSPWATLPPVEKVPPVQINTPVQQPPPHRFSQRDTYGNEAQFHPAPAKEIAPDDFNRSWRDERGNRELYNSHSGRYEPVNETRRGSFRDGYRNQPAVLQRPAHDGPAEPSAAFQTSRTSADAPTWGRRRTSSNVSGGSGGRRLSIDRRGPEIPLPPLNVQRRGSHSINGADGLSPIPRHAFPAVPEQPLVSPQKSSPNLSIAQPTSPYGSVGSFGAQDGTAPAPAVQTEDPVEVQNRLMREKLERARLAKQKQLEQEQKEEAERKERLRKKLENLGHTEDTKAKGNERSPSQAAERSPQKGKAVPVPVHSPPKPPVPTSEGEIAQYGMMKVHQPHPVKKQHAADMPAGKPMKGADAVPKPSPSPNKQIADLHSKAATPPNGEFFTEPHAQSANTLGRDNRHNKVPLEQSQTQTQMQQPEGEARAQVLKSSQPPQAAWAAPSLQQPRPWSTVWGPPQTKDRALGNGIFDSSYRAQHSSTQHLASPPNPSQSSSLNLNSQLKPTPSSQTHLATGQPFAQSNMFSKPDHAAPPQVGGGHKPGPIAPPIDKGWGNFAAAIKQDDRAHIEKARQEHDRMGGEAYRPDMSETYQSRKNRVQATLHDNAAGHRFPKGDTKPELPQGLSELKPKDDLMKATIEVTLPQQTSGQSGPSQQAGARPSRFFPRPTEPAVQAISAFVDPDSPPPPETEQHPAFTGDSTNPVVKMPRPSPRVRLPPAAIAESTTSADAAVSMPRSRLGARPLALNPEWQARFNSLLDKGSNSSQLVASGHSPTLQAAIPVKPSALAIAASSKAPLEVRGNVAAATVSLPRRTFSDDNSSEKTSRTSAEAALLEEREFGSLPIVKPPKVPHLASHEPPAGFPPNGRPNSKFQRPMDITTKPILNILDYEQNAEGIEVKVRLGNMTSPVTKFVARKRGNSSRKSSGQKGPKRTTNASTNPSSSSQTQRARKPSNFQRENSNSNNTSRSSGNSGWNSNRSTPPHSSSTWTRRAAPVH
ncbi:hypothetical protein BU24DRAFT_129549 [Aaosphaeria arxii CBS 175.79]|uniref:Uncharacterized protein n=1 Tax=Aaosphaeria arxii CBS 175.79 TaxID=1450172 RepID=A0A6A5Y5U7_9PLEO|nr:uncharacterized protein BU24DRAFT_129549 [Aaosphaeria arxii CBS 175.79]KAF2019924.1 hypothetical protein BU24DRAFT_129549 [Aaosphaeria arxii CBS 175.79]